MKVEKLEPLKCEECGATEVEKKGKTIKCYGCKTEFKEGDKPKKFHIGRTGGGAGGRNTSRYEMGDYFDHRGI